jgi:hypothetical protein
VGKQDRSKQKNKAPISSHPLFPAVIALWFGALFGLGSLAIRPALLEKLVLAVQLDTVIESAAPPLGMTTRILLAVFMAVIGAILGGLLARIIARPKVYQKVRVRKAGQAAAPRETKPAGFGQNYARAPQPSMSEGVAVTAEKGRRRPLAVAEHNESEFEDISYLGNAVPLPGGAPEIFDVKAQAIPPMMATSLVIERAIRVEEPLELTALEVDPSDIGAGNSAREQQDSYSYSATKAETDDHVVAVRNAARSDADWTETAERSDRDSGHLEFGQSETGELSVDNEFTQPFDLAAFNSLNDSLNKPSSVYPNTEEAIASIVSNSDHTQTTSAPIPMAYEPPEETPHARFATQQATANESVAPAFEAEPFDGALADNTADTTNSFSNGAVFVDDPTAVAPSSFAAPNTPDFNAYPPLSEQPPLSQFSQIEAAEQVQFGPGIAPIVAEQFAVAQATDTSTEVEPVQLAIQPEPQVEAPLVAPVDLAPASATTSLADLSSLELIERLALSIRNRTGEQGLPRAEDLPVSLGAVAKESLVPEEAPPISSSPSAQQTTQASAEEPSTTTDGVSRLSIPAALRPINFAEYEDDDAEDSFVPARSITLPPRVAIEPSASAGNLEHGNGFASVIDATDSVSSASVIGQPSIATEEFAPATEDAEDEDSYSSLLNVSKPSPVKQNFFRIEEPEDQDSEIEPVVIFPGQGTQAGLRFSAPAPLEPASSADGASAASAPVNLEDLQKRFATQPTASESKAPAQIKPGNAFAPPGVDPAETERALRSALATLQRMTGAA